MLERSDIFTDEMITDELLGFFGAATETTNNTIITTLSHLMQSSNSIKKVRDDYGKLINQKVGQDPSLKNLNAFD